MGLDFFKLGPLPFVHFLLFSISLHWIFVSEYLFLILEDIVSFDVTLIKLGSLSIERKQLDSRICQMFVTWGGGGWMGRRGGIFQYQINQQICFNTKVHSMLNMYHISHLYPTTYQVYWSNLNLSVKNVNFYKIKNIGYWLTVLII